jgi:hypothetical protein
MEQLASAEIQVAANDLIGNMNENFESQMKLQDRVLANDITKMLESSEPPFLSHECCIYKVPTDLREVNEKAYTPQVISIGPFHHGDERLETMEKLKVTYFKRFVQKTGLNMENLVSTIRDREAGVRHCYSHTSGLSSDDYVKMILLDASFIIVFFLICRVEEWRDYYILTPFSQRLMGTALGDIWLLENQLPFFIIKDLYNLAFASHSEYHSFTQLTCELFEDLATDFCSLQTKLRKSPYLDFKIMHFADLFRTFSLPQSQRLQKRKPSKQFIKHLYSASQLDEAGVKFKVGSSECLFDLKFTKGVLEIPCLKLYDYTGSRFRNFMALEQCHYLSDHYVTDYIRLLDFLIDIDKDTDLLVRKGILVHTLGDNNAVTTLVNKLGQRIRLIGMNSNYCCLCEKLNTFYEDPWHSWKVVLRRDYFSTPWRTSSTAAAVIFLVLTVIQTICSIIQLV